MSMENISSLAEFERQAIASLPPHLFTAWFGGPGHEHQAAIANRQAFERTRLVPRGLSGIGEQTLSTTVVGTRVELPVLLGAVGGQIRFHSDGEIGSSRAAAAAGTVFTLPTGAHFTIEEVAAASSGPKWMQLYYLADDELNKLLVQRAEAAGFKALLVTVDNAGISSSERLARFYRGSRTIPWRNLTETVPGKVPASGDCFELVHRHVGWKDILRLRKYTSLPILVKGIQSVADAKLCVEHGLNGLIVSNHGGHALHSLRGTLDTLVDIADAVGSQIEVLMDGGVRSGEDVLKALAAGARAVLIGRGLIWPLTAGGQEGVARALAILRTELSRAMRLSGVGNVAEVPRELLYLGR